MIIITYLRSFHRLEFNPNLLHGILSFDFYFQYTMCMQKDLWSSKFPGHLGLITSHHLGYLNLATWDNENNLSTSSVLISIYLQFVRLVFFNSNSLFRLVILFSISIFIFFANDCFLVWCIMTVMEIGENSEL
jgi:hypothetical protein